MNGHAVNGRASNLPERRRRRARVLEDARAGLADGTRAAEELPVELLRSFADANLRERHTHLRDGLRGPLTELGMFGLDEDLALDRKVRVAELRRSRRAVADDPLGTLALVDDQGILRWEPHSAVSSLATGRRASRRSARRGVVVQTVKFEALGANQLGRFLESVDDKLTPSRGFRHLDASLALQRTRRHPAAGKRYLLLVHGTFSSCDHFVAELASTDKGVAFLREARRRYDAVLTFDHPTLSLTPVMNAVDLARAFGDKANHVDVIAHSRGGLVTRWWIEALEHRADRVGSAVLVGSPLAGTSLAAPPALRRALDLLTNVWQVLEKTSALIGTAVPLATVVSGLAKVVGSAMKLAARTPLVDGAVMLIPGLAAQSRVSNNPDIYQLRRGAFPWVDKYAAITADFEPDPVGWRFWRLFTQKPAHRVANFGADLLFRGSNDLVVDSAAMTDLAAELQIQRRLQVVDAGRDDRTTGTVHHLSYFRDARVVDALPGLLRWD